MKNSFKKLMLRHIDGKLITSILTIYAYSRATYDIIKICVLILNKEGKNVRS